MVTGDFAQLSKILKFLINVGNGAAAQSVTRVIAEECLSLVNDGFEQSVDPYGKPWDQPKMRGAIGGSIAPLRKSGALQRSYHVAMTGKFGFAVRTGVRYAATHQFGALIEPKARKFLRFRGITTVRIGERVRRRYSSWVFAKRSRIPVRMMLPTNGLSDRWATRMLSAAASELSRVTASIGGG